MSDKYRLGGPPASKVGHVVAAARYGPDRGVTCSCGDVIGAASDEAMVDAYREHRRTAPPESFGRIVMPPGRESPLRDEERVGPVRPAWG